MSRRHREDETVDHCHDDDVDSTSLRTFTAAQQRVADVLGWSRRLCERDWRAVQELGALVGGAGNGLSPSVSAELAARDHIPGPSVARNVTNERRSA